MTRDLAAVQRRAVAGLERATGTRDAFGRHPAEGSRP